nr:hypothetical protein [Bradyrhizobium cenepequi]
MASFTQLPSGNWRVQVRRKNRYVSETFRRRKDGEDWALYMERNIDRSGSPKPRAAVQAKTFGDIIDLHIEDMHEVGRPPRRSKAAVLEAVCTENLNPDVVVMESAEDVERFDASGPLNRASNRRVLIQRPVRSEIVVIACVRSQDPA